MMPPVAECSVGGCPQVARYRVVDVEGDLRREVCGDHLPRGITRLLRKAKGGVVVEPLDAQILGDLLPLLAVGASVYGLVSDPTAALAFANMSDETARSFLETLSRVDLAPAVREVRERIADIVGDTDPADVIPFPDSWERHESPDEQA